MCDARFPLLDNRFSTLNPEDRVEVRRNYKNDRTRAFSRFDAKYFANADIDGKCHYK